jgi:hypothetical protein
MFKVRRIKHFILFVMKQYKLVTTEGEYLVTIEAEKDSICITKDANNIYRSVRKDKLVEV